MHRFIKKIFDCCGKHDKYYGKPSTVSRREADKFLRECVTAAGHPVLAWFMRSGVRSMVFLFWEKYIYKGVNIGGASGNT